MTGETGAGKSIVIDALGAVLGARTLRELIRSGCARALVSAVFFGVPPSAAACLDALGIEFEKEIIVSREIFSDGRNVCKVNGRPVTVAQLRELGVHLVQIHGQHDTQSLLSEDRHLGILDAFARTDQQPYRAAYEEWKAIGREMDALRMDEDEKARRMDTLQYRIGEIEDAGLVPGEEAELLSRRKLLQNAQKITGALDAAYAGLYGDEDSPGAIELLDAAAQALDSISRVSESFLDLAGRASDLRYSAEDISGALREKRGEMELAPDEIAHVETRLDLLYKLKSKFGAPPDELILRAEKWKRELEDIAFAEEKLRALETKHSTAQKSLEEESRKLTKMRTKAAASLEKRVIQELEGLDMGKVRFSAVIGEAQPGTDGADSVSFFLAANPGEPLKPLSKTASGGELSRIMLAMKNASADNDEAVSLVFDEVDAGVSGRAAQRVAEKMFSAAAKRQVLCVTHLPQIAAMADTHFLIAKGVSGERTVTSVTRLEYAERVEELARITGGSQITAATRDGARELIEGAQTWKNTLQGDL